VLKDTRHKVSSSRIRISYNIFEDVTLCSRVETLVPAYQITRSYVTDDDLNICRRKTSNLKTKLYVGFEILTAAAIKSSIFWGVTLLKVNTNFGGTCRIHLQGKRIKTGKGLA
jgi:hypothetical protein